MAPKQRRCFLVGGIVALVCILIEKSPTASAAIIPRCEIFSEEYDIRNAGESARVSIQTDLRVACLLFLTFLLHLSPF